MWGGGGWGGGWALTFNIVHDNRSKSFDFSLNLSGSIMLWLTELLWLGDGAAIKTWTELV